MTILVDLAEIDTHMKNWVYLLQDRNYRRVLVNPAFNAQIAYR
jgi:hypothetical protein